jgi:hypothetical protein
MRNSPPGMKIIPPGDDIDGLLLDLFAAHITEARFK